MSSMVQPTQPTPHADAFAQFPAPSGSTKLRAVAGTTYEASLIQGQEDPRLERQFRRLTEHVVSEFPVERGGSLLVVGTGSNSHVADVAGQLAKNLTDLYRGEVLLVDADFERKVLTQRFATTAEQGLIEAMQTGLAARGVVVNTTIANLKFLPLGESSLARRTLHRQSLEAIVDQLKREYRYLFVAASMQQVGLASEVSRHCDGTYLVVQLGKTNRDDAISAERNLTAAGARLLGTITTGVA